MSLRPLGRPTSPRAALDLSLYLVTDTRLCGQVGVSRTVELAVAAGVTVVQLRDPQADDDTFVGLGREVLAALRDHARAQGSEPIPLLVNDRVHLAGAIGADGAHIGQGDLPVAQARALLDDQLGPHAVLGLSVQTREHVQDAVRRHHDPYRLTAQPGLRPGPVDYLGIGPVYEQTTKPDAAEPGGPDLLRDLVALSPWPSVAIGGIDADRAPELRATGVDGIAVVSAICGQPDVAAATRRLRTAWDGAGAS